MNTLSNCLLSVALLLPLVIGCGGTDPGSPGTAGNSVGSGGSGPGGGTPGTGGTSAGNGGGGVAVPDGCPTTGKLLPFAKGNTWTYKVTDTDGTSNKTTTVGDLEKVGGVQGPHKDDQAYHVITEKADGTDKSESWQNVEGDRVVRYRELSFSKSTQKLALEEYWDPHKVHIDSSAERTSADFQWQEQYREFKLSVGGAAMDSPKADLWKVLSAGESVEVPAGKFCAVKLQKTSGGDTAKTYWYVRGVGKVKETGSQTEELVSYTVAP